MGSCPIGPMDPVVPQIFGTALGPNRSEKSVQGLAGLVNSHSSRTWKRPIEIVDLAIEHGDFPVRYVVVCHRVIFFYLVAK